MATIRKRTISGRRYYYLEHSVRKGGKTVKKEIYLGKSVPDDIDALKKGMLFELYKDKWFSSFERIRKNYARSQKIEPPSSRAKNMQAFATRFTYNTQRIEGSRLTYRETANLLEHGITPNNKPLDDVKEAEAHRRVFYDMLEYPKDLSMQAVLHWHKRLFEGTKSDMAGKTRTHGVMISGSRFTPPLPSELDFMVHEFFNWYSQNKKRLNPVELAALVHLKFVTIHPFGDGNGRISRLMMNFVLHRHGYPMLDIPYEKRGGYYTALERSQLKGDSSPFLNWFFRRYLKECNRLL
jgi:Fic family protein